MVAAALSDPAGDERVVSLATGAADMTGSRVIMEERLAKLSPSPGSERIAPGRARTQLVRAVGKRVGAIEIIYRPRTSTRPEATLTAKGDCALSVAEFDAVLQLAVAAHNEAACARLAAALEATQTRPSIPAQPADAARVHARPRV